ncbi:MAG: glycosyltransferase [Azospirillum sp.]|nr:glycosyltransferase [Azospirillum sp.]
MTMSEPKSESVSAIVVSYWTGPALVDCLDALIAQAALTEIIVVNNGNSVETVTWLQELARREPRLCLVEPGFNTGFAAGCNFGVNHAFGDYLAFVNPDLILPDTAIEQFLEVFRTHPGVWLCGGRLVGIDGQEQRGGRREVLSPWRAFVELSRLDRLLPNHPYFRRLHLYQHEEMREICEVPTVSGAFMMIPRRLYQRLGGMDDNMFLHFEDADLCIRVRQNGGRILYCGHIPVRHHLSTSDVSRFFVELHKTRSTSYYFFKHFIHDYPNWVIFTVCMLLWVRLTVLTPRLLIRDLPGMIRRQRRGRGSISSAGAGTVPEGGPTKSPTTLVDVIS